MTRHALGSDGEPSDALSHKESGKEEQGKAGILRDMLVYTGLIRGLERREAKRRRKTSQVFWGTHAAVMDGPWMVRRLRLPKNTTQGDNPLSSPGPKHQSPAPWVQPQRPSPFDLW